MYTEHVVARHSREFRLTNLPTNPQSSKRQYYVALGDSVTAGYGATHPGLGFVRHVETFSQKHKLTRQTILIAKNGWTTKDVWNATQMMDSRIWDDTSVLTLMTGGNDLRKLLRRQYLSISGTPLSPQAVSHQLEQFEYHMEQLCGFLATKKIPHILVATVYNPVPNFALGVHAIEGLNKITQTITSRYRFPLVDVYEGFRSSEAYYIENYRFGRLSDLSSPFRRPIHPNNNGHKKIADLIMAELMRQTTSKSSKMFRKNRAGKKK